MIKPDVAQQLLQFVQNEWQNLDFKVRPWGMWISSHETVAVAATMINTPAHTVWFLNNKGIEQHNIWEYARFVSLHKQQVWSQRPYGEPYTGITEIGWAAFAEYTNSSDILLEIQLSSLYGYGYLASIDPNTVLQIKDVVWIS